MDYTTDHTEIVECSLDALWKALVNKVSQLRLCPMFAEPVETCIIFGFKQGQE